jgi:hypothetical protein
VQEDTSFSKSGGVKVNQDCPSERMHVKRSGIVWKFDCLGEQKCGVYKTPEAPKSKVDPHR